MNDKWGKVTGADKGQKVPVQQASVLGRIGNFVVIYPYGMYCDLPNDVYLKEIAKGVVIPAAIDRPDAARGEPIFYHPETNTRIIARNNGDLDIIAGNVNITADMTTINGDLTVAGETHLSSVVTSSGKDIGLNHGHSQGNDSDGNSEQDINGVL